MLQHFLIFLLHNIIVNILCIKYDYNGEMGSSMKLGKVNQ